MVCVLIHVLHIHDMLPSSSLEDVIIGLNVRTILSYDDSSEVVAQGQHATAQCRSSFGTYCAYF